jgi:hypothetical protein
LADDTLEPVTPAFRELVYEDSVFRAILKKRHLTAETLREAFMLRSTETGLSVCYDCKPEDCFDLIQMDMHGVAKLIVGRVRGLGLKVIPNEQHHANIEGVPHKEENEVEAERLASALAEIADIVDRTTRKK